MTLSLSKYLYIIYYFRQMVKYFVIIFNYIENKVNDWLFKREEDLGEEYPSVRLE